ncbi:MAG: hypothetical protein KQA41_04410 [Candidatus Aenigmarchaeota archaeon]|nr:hypothetical protein [Candidatus Aenigmarchaeota archaeon]MBU5689438.1 hypothetical protein [Candidatus Aenigmarchaeota archaeon]
MTQAPLPGLIKALQTQGVFEIYLPFLLTFSLFYGLLRRIGLFGKDSNDTTSNKISALVAFVAAMYITIFSPAAIPISKFFATFFTQSSIAIVVIMISIMLITMFFSLPFLDPNQRGRFTTQFLNYLVIGALLVVLGMFVSSGGVQLFTSLLPPGTKISGEDIGLFILVIATIIIIAMLLQEQTPNQQRPRFSIIEYPNS